MEKGATVKLVYDVRTKRAKVRVTFNRQPRVFSTLCNKTLTQEEFENTKLKITKTIIAESENALVIAQEICDELGNNFSFPKFTKLYHDSLYGDKPVLSDKFGAVAAAYISNLQTASSKSIYQTAVNWVLRYNKNITLQDIEPEDIISFIKTTHKAETGRDISENSIRIYLRSIRAIYNQAVQAGITKRANPFSHIKGQPLSSLTREKGALSDDELRKFLKYEPVNSIEQFGQDMFILSIHLSGANMGDIISLKNSNIIDNEVHFIRRKTRKSGQTISIPFTSTAKELLRKYGVISDNAPDDYILPFLSQCRTEKSIRNKIHDIIKKANKGIKSICTNIGIRDITTYNARHTYASYAQDFMTTEQIQKFLGHTSPRTTETYLGSISQNIKEKNRDFLENLTNR